MIRQRPCAYVFIFGTVTLIVFFAAFVENNNEISQQERYPQHNTDNSRFIIVRISKMGCRYIIWTFISLSVFPVLFTDYNVGLVGESPM